MAKNPAGAPGGVIYEPRSLWSVTNIDTTPFADFVPSEGQPLQYLYKRFLRNDLRNGSKDPITITRVAMIGLNYIYAIVPNSFANVPNTIFDAGSTALNQMRLRYSVPGRQSYSRFEIVGPSYGIKPTWGEPAIASSRANTFGVCRLKYEKPFYVPRTVGFEMQLSSPSDVSYVGPPAIPDVFASNGVTQVNAEINWLELGGLNPGSSRSKRFPVRLSGDPNQFPGQNGYPYSLPPNFTPATDNGIRFWDRRNTFSAGEFRKQEATRAGSSVELGVSVAIDQFDYDTVLITEFGDTGKIAPLSTRIGSQVKCVDFGSQENWWRPGAPIALTFDTVTPALVMPLPQPVTLQPGDCFEVELQVPGPQYFSGFGNAAPEGVTQNAPNYQIGISFNGYATIKG